MHNMLEMCLPKLALTLSSLHIIDASGHDICVKLVRGNHMNISVFTERIVLNEQSVVARNLLITWRGYYLSHSQLNRLKGGIMQKTKLFIAALGVMFSLPALAEDAAVTQHKEDIHVIPASAHTVTSNIGLFSDYLYRGISQTNAKPAIQGGFDYAHSSGLYAGVWGSSISWLTDSPAITGATNSQLELDTYFGFKNSFAGDFTYDMGFLRYNYPASYNPIPAGSAKADTDEIYGALGYKFVTAKLSYSLGDTFGIAQARGTTYFDLSANYPIADTGFTIGAHVGRQAYKGTATDTLVAANSTPTYTDYKIGATKDLGGFVVSLAYSSTNANRTQYTNGLNKYLGRGTAVLSLSRSF